jgi:hypothetical protein
MWIRPALCTKPEASANGEVTHTALFRAGWGLCGVRLGQWRRDAQAPELTPAGLMHLIQELLHSCASEPRADGATSAQLKGNQASLVHTLVHSNVFSS